MSFFSPPPSAPAAPGIDPGLAWGITGTVWHLIGAGLAISACYGRLKYS